MGILLLLLLLYLSLAVFAAGIATAIAAGLALIGAGLTLNHADATAKRARTAEYRAHWDHPDLLEARIATARFLDVAESKRDRQWKDWRNNMGAKQRLQLMAVLNFWEAVSGAYNQGLLDSEWFGQDLAWELSYNWERAEWFIRKYRTEDQNALGYCEWQRALEAVKADLDRQSRVGKIRAEQALAQKEDILYIDQPG